MAAAFRGAAGVPERCAGEGASAKHVQLHAHEQCRSVEHLREELARVEALGGEGLMLRQPGSKYEVGRSTTLLKVKTFHDAEARVVDHQAGSRPAQGPARGAARASWPTARSSRSAPASPTPSATARRRSAARSRSATRSCPTAACRDFRRLCVRPPVDSLRLPPPPNPRPQPRHARQPPPRPAGCRSCRHACVQALLRICRREVEQVLGDKPGRHKRQRPLRPDWNGRSNADQDLPRCARGQEAPRQAGGGKDGEGI